MIMRRLVDTAKFARRTREIGSGRAEVFMLVRDS